MVLSILPFWKKTLAPLASMQIASEMKEKEDIFYTALNP